MAIFLATLKPSSNCFFRSSWCMLCLSAPEMFLRLIPWVDLVIFKMILSYSNLKKINSSKNCPFLLVVMCWHLILARYRLQWRWSRVNRFSSWKDSRCWVEQLWWFGYIHSTLSYGLKLYSECHNSMFRVVFGQSRLQDDLGWRSTLKELSSSRWANRFWYINHLNPSSYAKVRGNTLQAEAEWL